MKSCGEITESQLFEWAKEGIEIAACLYAAVKRIENDPKRKSDFIDILCELYEDFIHLELKENEGKIIPDWSALEMMDLAKRGQLTIAGIQKKHGCSYKEAQLLLELYGESEKEIE